MNNLMKHIGTVVQIGTTSRSECGSALSADGTDFASHITYQQRRNAFRSSRALALHNVDAARNPIWKMVPMADFDAQVNWAADAEIDTTFPQNQLDALDFIHG